MRSWHFSLWFTLSFACDVVSGDVFASYAVTLLLGLGIGLNICMQAYHAVILTILAFALQQSPC